MTFGLMLLTAGIYMTVGTWWHEREDVATRRYHRSCDKMFCGWVE
jgi:hypothetical protein